MSVGPGEQLLKHLGCFWSWDGALYLKGRRLMLRIMNWLSSCSPAPVQDVCPKGF